MILGLTQLKIGAKGPSTHLNPNAFFPLLSIDAIKTWLFKTIVGIL
jgi:hypothetical protein